jgi:type I restriction enzyme S subunit
MTERYNTYKPSGVDWIGEIPSHWSVKKLKLLKKDSKDSFIDGDWIESSDISTTGIRYITTGNIGSGTYKEQGSGFITEDTFRNLDCTELFPGELVISRLFSPIGRSCILPDLGLKVVTSVDNVILRPQDAFDKRFLNYYFNWSRYNEQCDLQARGTTLSRISRTILGNNPVIVPPVEEQQAIVHFLDKKTAQIDDTIQKKLRLIELLQEERTAIINQVVTRGFNVEVNMKSSGVDRLGSIPVDWEMKRVSDVSTLLTGFAFQSERFSFDEGIKLVRGDNITEGCLRWGEKARYWKDEDETLSKFSLKEHDLVIGMDGSKVGKNFALVPQEDLPLLLVQRVARIRSDDPTLQEWLFFWIGSLHFQQYVDIVRTDPAIPHITLKNIKDFPITVPPRSVMASLVKELKLTLRKIEDAMDKCGSQITLLQEFRTALINEIVTGKIRVTLPHPQNA